MYNEQALTLSSNRLLIPYGHAATKLESYSPRIMAQVTTGRSIKAAATPFAVFNALKAQVTEKGAIVDLGDFVENITIAQAGLVQVAGSKTSQRCRTNKFLPAIGDDLKAFMSIVLSMSVEDAREQAYAIKDRHCVNVNVWSDDPAKSKLLARRPFSGKVEAREYYSIKEDCDKVEYVFTSIALDDLATKSTTLNADEFSLEDPSAMAEDAAKAASTSSQTPAQARVAAAKAAMAEQIADEVGN